MNTETFKIICRAFYPCCEFESIIVGWVARNNHKRIAGTIGNFADTYGYCWWEDKDTDDPIEFAKLLRKEHNHEHGNF